MEAMSLFENNLSQPLAARLRPKTLEEYVGQTQLLGKDKVLRRLIESDQISSMIFWGPPGRRKNHAGPYHRRTHEVELHRLFRRDQRHQGNPHGDAAGR